MEISGENAAEVRCVGQYGNGRMKTCEKESVNEVGKVTQELRPIIQADEQASQKGQEERIT